VYVFEQQMVKFSIFLQQGGPFFNFYTTYLAAGGSEIGYKKEWKNLYNNSSSVK
jgi:hypothetical protein